MSKHRRITTGFSATVTPKIIGDDYVETLSSSSEPSSTRVSRLWATEEMPVDVHQPYNTKTFSHIEKPGVTQFVLLCVPPTQIWLSP